MPEMDLGSIWTVLETGVDGADDGIDVSPTGVSVTAGEVLVGVDRESRRHVLVPLAPGEAFAEDRQGRGVQLWRVRVESRTYAAVVCLDQELRGTFEQFAAELLRDIPGESTVGRAVSERLERWRRLFAGMSRAGTLDEQRLIGLLAELLTLEEIVGLDDQRRVDLWTGPDQASHDFRRGSTAVEVKATTVREGRIVGIHGVEQLQTPESGELFLSHFRFRPDSQGVSIPFLVDRIGTLGVSIQELDHLLLTAGYLRRHAEHYESRRYAVVERRIYNVNAEAFPKIVPESFPRGLPAGTLNLRYSIDLTNEPPAPMSEDGVKRLMAKLATS